MLEVVVDNRIRICAEGLEPELTAALKDAFSHANPAFELRRAIGVPTWGEPRTIRTWRAEHTPAGAGLSFPRGGMQRVRDAFAEHGVDWREVDNREPGLPADIPDLLRELYPYQAELLGPLIARENAILRAPTGSGKSLCALAIAARLKLPTVVMVHTRALFDQWVQRARDDLGLRKSAVGKIRGGLWKVGDLTIAIQKSLAVAFARNDLRALKLADETGLFIVDEVQGASAKTFMETIEPFRARYRFGISASEKRKDKKEFLIYDMFGAVAAEVTRDTLIDSGHVLDVEVRVIPTEFAAPWYGLPDGEEPKELDFNRLLNEMGADPVRTKLALDVAQLEVEAGEQVLLMTHHRDLCRVLDRALAERNIRTGFLVGGEPKEFEATVRGLAKGKVRAAVGTFQAVGTGIDLPRVGVGIAVTPIAGNQQFFNQVRGRLCRTAAGKTSARIYYLLDTAVYPSSHLRNLVKWNRKVVVWKDGKWVDAAKVLRPGRAA